MVIYKYELPSPGTSKIIKAPIEKVLHVELQYDIPTIWCLLDKEKEDKEVVFVAVGTGWEIEVTGWQYAGTLQEDGFVWHYFVKGVE